MIRPIKIIHVLASLYSIILIIFGVYLAYTLYVGSDLFKTFFAELVTPDTWILNFKILSLLDFSSGIMGLIIAVQLWKGKEGIERLWLIFITWQFGLSIIQKGSYIIGTPHLLEIVVVGTLCFASWGALFQYINTSKTSNISTITKPLLTGVMISQFVAVMCINSIIDPVAMKMNNLSKTEYEEKLNDSILNSFSSNIDYDLFGKYYKKYNEFIELYEKRETKKLKEIGDFLLNNGYEKDRFILSVYAAEAYSRDDYKDSAKFLKAAIKGDYPSGLIKPTVRVILMDDAQLYYGAHIVYKELKENEKAKIAYEKAMQLFKDVAEDEYSKEYLEWVIELSTASLNHFKAKEITK